jgi:CMP/dCMP kinase
MKVVTISRQYGSGGDEIADLLCQALGYRRFNKRIISLAALEAGLSDQEIIDYSEDNYKIQNFFDRLLGRGRSLAEARIWKETTSGERISEITQISEEHALSLVKGAILSAYQAGEMVVLGRGGQVVLKDCADVLHIRVEAPLEDRIQRVKIEQKIERRAAQDLINERDEASADYIKRFYGVDWSDPLLYHLVINTGKLEIAHAAQMICDYARWLQLLAAPA